LPDPLTRAQANAVSLRRAKGIGIGAPRKAQVACPLAVSAGPSPAVICGIPPTPAPTFVAMPSVLNPNGVGLNSLPSGTRTTEDVDSSYDGHGAEGFSYVNGTSGNGDVWVAMDVITQQLNSPMASGDVNILFAPTMLGPNGNCLEASVVNANGNAGFATYGSTTMWFQIYDWCAPNGDPTNNGGFGVNAYHVLVDSAFMNNYVRVFTNGDGRPEIPVQLSQVVPSDQWQAMLYDSVSSKYYVVYQSTGTYSSHGVGWLMFEYYEEVGAPCSPIQTVGASGNRYTNDGTTWTLFDQTNATIMTAAQAGNLSCFLGDINEPAEPSYGFQGVPTDWGFYEFEE